MKIEHILELIDKVSASELTSFQYENGETKISMKCGKPVVVASNMPVQIPEIQEYAASKQMSALSENHTVEMVSGNIVKSPLVGTFYVAPAEDAAPFVKVGDQVKKGQIVAIVEAMKLMNEIECDFDGTIAEIYVENGVGVEYGQPLFRVE